jgi:hypothetical protein
VKCKIYTVPLIYNKPYRLFVGIWNHLSTNNTGNDFVELQAQIYHYPKVYKYKVVSTIFNDDFYGIEIIYLQERLHVLVKILAMGSLV